MLFGLGKGNRQEVALLSWPMQVDGPTRVRVPLLAPWLCCCFAITLQTLHSHLSPPPHGLYRQQEVPARLSLLLLNSSKQAPSSQVKI